jgi:hypothetical protein
MVWRSGTRRDRNVLRKARLGASGGYEYTLILGLSGLSLAFTGPGSLSLDALLGFNPVGALWGGTALLVGLAGGAIQLAVHSRAAYTDAAGAAHAVAQKA